MFRIIKALTAKTLKMLKLLSFIGTVEAVVRLAGYLDHRYDTLINVQLFWNEWAKPFGCINLLLNLLFLCRASVILHGAMT